MNIVPKTISFMIICFNSMNVLPQTVNMHLWATGENHNVPVKTVPLLDGYVMHKNGDDRFNRYGSDSRMKEAATGYFYTRKIDGRWYLVDPDGYAGVNMAVTSMPDMDTAKSEWAFGLLRKNGFNGTGNFFEKEDMTKRLFDDTHFERMSYTRRRNFFQKYRVDRQAIYVTPTAVKNYPENFITVFDPEFESFADNFASAFANYKNERDLLGYFSDNEINFTEDQLKLFLNVLPESDPNYKAAMNYLNSKGLSKDWVIANYDAVPEIRKEFLSLILERYFSVVSAAIKKYDPNHLYLGSRLHGKPRDCETVVTVASKYCDVVSVNYYNYVFPHDQICSPTKWGQWLEQYDKPCLISEFYAKQYFSSYPDQSGAGFYTDDQKGRGIFYQSSCLDVLRSKYYVGWQYFRWQDDPAPKFSNKGIVSPDDQEYTDMTSSMEELNRQVYSLIDYMDGRILEKNGCEIVLPAENDTYLQLSGAEQSTVNGALPQLSTAAVTSLTGRRDLVLKFDLGCYADSLDRLMDAKIRLYSLSGDTNRKLSVCGIRNTTWSEETLSGSSAATAGFLDDYGKMRTKTFSNQTQDIPVELNVRNWILGQGSGREVSFRITDEASGSNPAYWASNQYADPGLHPVLVLKMSKEETTALEEKVQTDNFDLFFNDNNLFVNGLNEEASCEIFSIAGERMLQLMIKPGIPYPCSISKGIYIVRMMLHHRLLTRKVAIG